MAITKGDILNKCLVLVGANPIVSIDDDTENARVLSRVYDLSLRSVLSETEWYFAMKRELLALSGDTLAWTDTTWENYVYVRPRDAIRIFSTNEPSSKWREEGQYIISDTSGLGVRYSWFIEDATKYPVFFVDALIDKLCENISYYVLNSPSKSQEFKETYLKISLPRAMSVNSQIGVPEYMKDDAWILAKDGDTFV